MVDVTISSGKVEITKVGGVEVLKHQVCGWAPPSYGDTGQFILHTILAVVSFGAVIWQAYEQLRVFRMRQKIADAWASMAEEDWRRFNTKYKPLESQMINESLSEPRNVVDYDGLEARYAGYAEIGYGGAEAMFAELAKSFRVCPDPSTNLWKEMARDDTVNFGYREAETYNQAMEDIRFNNRAELLNLGRDLTATAAKYGEASANILEKVSDNLGTAISDALNFLGYYRNRLNPEYPTYPEGAYGFREFMMAMDHML
jgi:hypothetical protein